LKKGLDPDLDPYIKYTDPQHWFKIYGLATLALTSQPGRPGTVFWFLRSVAISSERNFTISASPGTTDYVCQEQEFKDYRLEKKRGRV